MYEHINNHYYVVLMIIHIQMYINSMFVCCMCVCKTVHYFRTCKCGTKVAFYRI